MNNQIVFLVYPIKYNNFSKFLIEMNSTHKTKLK